MGLWQSWPSAFNRILELLFGINLFESGRHKIIFWFDPAIGMEPMSRERLEQLRALLKLEPDDAFLRYAAGMELKGLGEFDDALAYFEGLMNDTPPNVPAYFMAGQTLAEQGRIEEARAVLRDGIDAARNASDHHAAGEMSEFLASLGSA
jgi:tetratricopeptide (TPR) repeat protein